MKTLAVALAALSLAGCDKSNNHNDDAATGGIGTVGEGSGGANVVDDGDVGDGSADGNDDPNADDDSGDVPTTVYDVGAGGDYYCQFKDPGIYCDDNVAIECGDQGNVVADHHCLPDICQAGVGCVECLAGQYTCMGPDVMSCNAGVNPPAWELSETCDPAMTMGCDIATGTCVNLAPIGGVEPTGVYYQYADFTGGVFLNGYDVDSFGNRLYIDVGNAIDVYEVELLDSDGDGVLEPNQHPDNPDDMGPIEERVLTYIERLPWPSFLSQGSSELYVNADGIWAGGANISEMLFAGDGTTTVVATQPGWSGQFSQIGYDDINEVWYASNEQNRRVFQYNAATETWGLAFYFPPLAGNHMDGLEVVTQPQTGIPYVYVSDMTSDFIGQYRLDPNLGWVQENLFEYEGTSGAPVEGMGYGALNHFWATSGNSVYEIGGGDLADYVEPPG